MIIVLGAVRIRPGTLESALAISKKHVARSRTEPGCIAHGVYHDAEDGERLIFVEKWLDREALRAHFQVPESREFVRELQAYCAAAPAMNVYAADELRLQT
jgi:quinol monooxygenase YgiN